MERSPKLHFQGQRGSESLHSLNNEVQFSPSIWRGTSNDTVDSLPAEPGTYDHERIERPAASPSSTTRPRTLACLEIGTTMAHLWTIRDSWIRLISHPFDSPISRSARMASVGVMLTGISSSRLDAIASASRLSPIAASRQVVFCGFSRRESRGLRSQRPLPQALPLQPLPLPEPPQRHCRQRRQVRLKQPELPRQ